MRIFCYGRPGRTGKSEGKVKWLEVYDHTSPRYLTVTGNHWQRTAAAVTEQQAALDWLHAKYFVKSDEHKPAPSPATADLSIDDSSLLDKVMAASNGGKFRDLWNGNTDAYGGDDSTADLALCGLLAFWTQKDAGRIDRLFRQSGLMRPKWDRADYRQRTIDKVITECRETYTGGGRTHGSGNDAESPAFELPPGEVWRYRLAAGSAEDSRPVIDAIPGELHIVVNKAEQALLGSEIPAYQRVGVLVRPATLTTEVKVDNTTIQAGSLVIEPVNKTWLAETFNKVALWRKYNERKKSMTPADCPVRYAEHYLARKGDWNVPVLAGIIEAPTLRRDGSLLTQPGYDKTSGLYLNYTGLPVSVPDNPTKADALKALEVLKEPFEEFPFVAEIDRSVALSGLLTAVTRRSLRTAPYHAFDAPVPGAGKGLLVDTCALVATGRVATATTIRADEAETEKRLGALLMRGVSVINLDNAARPVDGDFLCSLATQETIDPRILGKSETATIPTNTATVFMTGNNLVLKGDMTRRVLLCRIDPRCERPDALQFKRNLHEFIPANRHRLLSAALTVLRAFVVAGSPAHGKAPYGSFEEWDRLIRGALLWLDQPDPLESRERIISNDPTATGLRALLTTWFETFGKRAVTVHEVIGAATPAPGTGTYSQPKGEELRHVLLDVVGNKDGITLNSRTFSHYLRRNRDKVADGYRLEEAGTDSHSKASLWRVKFSGVSGVSGVSSNVRENFRIEGGSKVGTSTAKNIGVAKTNTANTATTATTATTTAWTLRKLENGVTETAQTAQNCPRLMTDSRILMLLWRVALMRATEVICTLQQRGIALKIVAGSLKIAGSNKLTEREKSALKAHKASILKALVAKPSLPTAATATTATTADAPIAVSTAVTEALPNRTEPLEPGTTAPFGQRELDAIKSGAGCWVWSGVLEQWLFWVRDEERKAKAVSKGIEPGCIWTLPELTGVVGIPPAGLRDIAAIRRKFNGGAALFLRHRVAKNQHVIACRI